MIQSEFIKRYLPELSVKETNETRRYITPDGKAYPSVTTVTGIWGDDKFEEWRKQVGAEVADAISKAACDKGTAFHQLCEDYLRGKEMKLNMFEKSRFEPFRKSVLDNIGDVYALESCLYSDKFKIAGRVDNIGIWKPYGRIAVIDFKTASDFKHANDIENYFMQVAFYSLMFFERTGILVQDGIIAISVEHEVKPQLFEIKIKEWIPRAIEIREEYRIKFEK